MTERHTNIPAAYLILMKENKVLLLRRANTGFEDGKYGLVAGHVEPGETFTEAIIREAKEEADIDLLPEQLEMTHIMHRKSTLNAEERIDAYFVATEWKGDIKNAEPRKCDDLDWFDINNLPNNTIPYIKIAIKNVLSKKHYSEHGWE